MLYNQFRFLVCSFPEHSVLTQHALSQHDIERHQKRVMSFYLHFAKTKLLFVMECANARDCAILQTLLLIGNWIAPLTGIAKVSRRSQVYLA